MVGHVVIVGGFHEFEMIPVLREGFQSQGFAVTYMPSRGCIRERAAKDLQFADKEIIEYPGEAGSYKYNTVADFSSAVREAASGADLLIWHYAKDDRPAGLVESLTCPTVRLSWDDPLSLVWGEDYSHGFRHAVTGCNSRECLQHYRARGISPMWTLPPVSLAPVTPQTWEGCDIALTFYALYGGGAPWLTQLVSREDLIRASVGLGHVHVYGGWGRECGRDAFAQYPRTAFRGFRDTLEIPSVFAAAKIVPTHHPQPEAAGYVSPRDTVAIAAGAMLLSDDCAGVRTYLPEVLRYQSIGEYTRMVRWLLDHDDERQRRAVEAREHVLAEYGADSFAKRLLEHVS